ncbi:MAG: phage gp6-like head-tail connector protein [Holosporales bacterium]|jgi:uncharacterized phiE125 gp8 family phage protein|nr:phage gp6-like head-tail connector protein [Holosporales bacterium]
MNTIIEMPSFKLVSLEMLKAHLRIENDIEDVYLEKVIDMASDILESKIGKSISKKKYRYIHIDDVLAIMKKIYLPVQPVMEICSVREITPSSPGKELSFSKGTDKKGTYITIRNSKYPVEAQYYAGVANSYEQVPRDVQCAILRIARGIYEHSSEEMPKSEFVEYVLNSYKDISIS